MIADWIRIYVELSDHLKAPSKCPLQLQKAVSTETVEINLISWLQIGGARVHSGLNGFRYFPFLIV